MTQNCAWAPTRVGPPADRKCSSIPYMMRFTIVQLDMYRILRRQMSDNLKLSAASIESDAQLDRLQARGAPETHSRPEQLYGIKTVAGGTKTIEPRRTARRKSTASLASSLAANSVAWRKLAQFRRWSGVKYWLLTAIYAFEFVRYVAIELIGSHALRPYHYLDCYLPGRFRFIGRTNRISVRVIMIFLVTFILHRYIVHIAMPRFKFYALEFLFYDYEEVLASELKLASTAKQLDMATVRFEPHSGSHFAEGTATTPLHSEQPQGKSAFSELDEVFRRHTQETRPRGLQIEPHLSEHPNPVFYLRSPFESGQSLWILRPNRTSESMRLLLLFNRWMLFASIVFVFFFIALIYYSLLGAVISNLGFEMSYPACVEWIQKEQRNASVHRTHSTDPEGTATASLPYAHIYLAPERLAHQTPIDSIPALISIHSGGIPQLNAYSVARLIADLAVNNFWYFEFTAFFLAELYLLSLAAADLIINASEIKRKLLHLIERLQDARDTAQLTHDFIHMLELDTDSKPKPSGLRAKTLRDESSPVDHVIDGEQQEYRTVEQIVFDEYSAEENDDHYESSQESYDELEYGLAGQLDLDEADFGLKRKVPESSSMSHTDLIERLNNANPIRMGAESSENLQRGHELEMAISSIQAILVDHFGMVRGYNRMVVAQLTMIFSCWFAYTIVLIYFIGTTRSRSVEFEFIVTECAGTLFTTIFFSSAAFTRSLNFHIYTLITRAMALDTGSPTTKLRWATILKFYSPKPMYCFALYGLSEISWLFCLKFASWILSAFVVLANFYYISRAP